MKLRYLFFKKRITDKTIFTAKKFEVIFLFVLERFLLHVTRPMFLLTAHWAKKRFLSLYCFLHKCFQRQILFIYWQVINCSHRNLYWHQLFWLWLFPNGNFIQCYIVKKYCFIKSTAQMNSDVHIISFQAVSLSLSLF